MTRVELNSILQLPQSLFKIISVTSQQLLARQNVASQQAQLNKNPLRYRHVSQSCHHICTLNNRIIRIKWSFPSPHLEFMALHRKTDMLTFFVVTFKVGTNMQYLQQAERQEPLIHQLRDRLQYSQFCVMFNIIALLDFLKLNVFVFTVYLFQLLVIIS